MTTTRQPLLSEFWTTITPTQRAILATTAEMHFNKQHPSFAESIGERTRNIEQGSESGSIDLLTVNVCDHIEKTLEEQGDEATLETVIKSLLVKK